MDRSLGRVVGGLHLRAIDDEPGQRSDVHDHPAAAGDHLRANHSAAVPKTVDVHIHTAPPLLRRHFQRRSVEAHPCVVDEDVDRPELLCDRLDHRRDARRVRDIRSNGARPQARRPPDPTSERRAPRSPHAAPASARARVKPYRGRGYPRLRPQPCRRAGSCRGRSPRELSTNRPAARGRATSRGIRFHHHSALDGSTLEPERRIED